MQQFIFNKTVNIPFPPTIGFSRRHSRWGAPILVFPAKTDYTDKPPLITHAPTCRVLNRQVKRFYNVKYISCINAMVKFTLMSASTLSKVLEPIKVRQLVNFDRSPICAGLTDVQTPS